MTALSAPPFSHPARKSPGSPPSAAERAGSRDEPALELRRTIKYESDRVKGFGREVMSVPGCEQLENCIQCGTCSGLCPLSIYMDSHAAAGDGADAVRFQERGPAEHDHLAVRLVLRLHGRMPEADSHHRHHVRAQAAGDSRGILSQALPDSRAGPGILQDVAQARPRDREFPGHDHVPQDERAGGDRACGGWD